MAKKLQPDFVPNTAPTPQGAQTGWAILVGRWLLLGGFAVLILVPPLYQVYFELKEKRKVSILNFPNNRSFPLNERLRAFENYLEEQSEVEKLYRRNYSELAYKYFHEGNHKVVVGKGDTLHFWTDLRSIIGRDPTVPVPRTVTKEDSAGHQWVSAQDAILDFAAQLQQRGIQLMLVPVPPKVSIVPETLGVEADRPLVHPKQEAIYDKLRSAGVDVVDLGPALWALHRKTPMFLKRDTHWTPEAMARAALETSLAVKSYQEFPGIAEASQSFTTELVPQAVTSVGDLNFQLSFPQFSRFITTETVLTHKIFDQSTGKPVEPDADAPIVFIGDSFSVIYSSTGQGFNWGNNAGFANHLMGRLGLRIDSITVLGGGATSVRKLLVEKHGNLEGKKLVIWLLASRLITMDEDAARDTELWEKVKIPATGSGTWGREKAAATSNPTSAQTTSTEGLPAGAVAKVRAKVIAIAAFPDPATTQTPYPNMLTQLSYELVDTVAGQPIDKSFRVLHWAFRDNKLTTDLPQVGDEVELILSPKVPPAAAVEQLARAEIVNDDGEEVILPSYWPMEFKNLSRQP